MAAAFPQGFVNRARRHHGGHESEQQAGRQRNRHRQGEHRDIERDLIEPWHRNPIGHERKQAAMERKRQHKAGYAAGRAKQETLAEQLCEQTATPRTERGADAQFALPRCASRQQQIRDVHTRDEQHQPHRAGQDQQRRPNLFDHQLVHRHQHRRPAVVSRVASRWRSDISVAISLPPARA